MSAADSTAQHHHGFGGAFVGGDWVPIEECASRFNISHGSDRTRKERCGGDCATCPNKGAARSRSSNSAARKDGTYDVVIIGAGCIGSAVARELSRTMASVLLLEAADDVTQGATKGNSGIVHAGFDDTPGSVRAKFCWKGNQMFPQLDRELHFGFERNGSLVVAFSEEEEAHLLELQRRGERNGVERLRIVGKEELFRMEPYLNPKARAALYAPDAGNLIPYEYAIALAENAVDNGVELRIRREVVGLEKGSDGLFTIRADHWEPRKYLDAIKKVSPTDKASDASNRNYYIIAGALVVCAVAIQAGLGQGFIPLNSDSSSPILINLPYVFIACAVLVLIPDILSRLRSSSGSGKGAAGGSSSGGGASAFASPPVGEGGEKVSVDNMRVGGTGSKKEQNGEVVETETIKARFVVNCAGSYSDKIAHMIGDDSFKIKPRLGDYILMSRDQGKYARHTLFPCPGPLGKGVLVQTTLWGMLILGPTARDSHLPDVMNETAEDIQRFILEKCSQLVPFFDPKEAITSFCGVRAKSTRGDWIIEPSQKDASFIHAAGIDSPGLAGSPAIAVEVVRLLHEAGLPSEPNPDFNPNRAAIIVPKNGWKGIKAGPVGKYTDPKENVVCKCEKVTEAEVVEAIHRSLPVDSTQAIRKRTRAGMGVCQGDAENYNCECRVADIIARETGLPVEAVGRRPWPASGSLPRRWLNDSDRAKLEELSK